VILTGVLQLYLSILRDSGKKVVTDLISDCPVPPINGWIFPAKLPVGIGILAHSIWTHGGHQLGAVPDFTPQMSPRLHFENFPKSPMKQLLSGAAHILNHNAITTYCRSSCNIIRRRARQPEPDASTGAVEFKSRKRGSGGAHGRVLLSLSFWPIKDCTPALPA
jgi:hypothetical protein